LHECVALFFLERMIHLNHTHISTYLQHLSLKYKVFFLLSIFLFPALVQAEESSLNFHVVPELPASQVDSTNSYFDLNLAPGSKEKLSLKLHNGSEETIQVRITPHTAYTNVHGSVEYGKKAEDPDPTLLYSLDELIESPDVVELSGNETKTVNLSLQMPDSFFDGFLAGGLRISEVKEETEETVSKQEGVAVICVCHRSCGQQYSRFCKTRFRALRCFPRSIELSQCNQRDDSKCDANFCESISH